MNIKCDCCNDKLYLGDFKIIQGIEKIKVCKECEEPYIKKIKSQFYVETYKNNNIY